MKFVICFVLCFFLSNFADVNLYKSFLLTCILFIFTFLIFEYLYYIKCENDKKSKIRKIVSRYPIEPVDDYKYCIVDRKKNAVYVTAYGKQFVAPLDETKILFCGKTNEVILYEKEKPTGFFDYLFYKEPRCKYTYEIYLKNKINLFYL